MSNSFSTQYKQQFVPLKEILFPFQNTIMYGSRFPSYALLGALAVLSTVNAHGYVTNPPSRQASCKQGTKDKALCGGVQYEPQSVEALKGGPFHRDVGAAVCNGNGARFDELNTQGSTLWPKSAAIVGQDIDVGWLMTSSRKTTGYYYYATKQDWDQSKATRLTKEDFDEIPILYVDGHHETSPIEVVHTLLPSQLGTRSGYTVILAVWETADTPNSFYNCLDLELLPPKGMTIQGAL